MFAIVVQVDHIIVIHRNDGTKLFITNFVITILLTPPSRLKFVKDPNQFFNLNATFRLYIV